MSLRQHYNDQKYTNTFKVQENLKVKRFFKRNKLKISTVKHNQKFEIVHSAMDIL